ncbi:MAG: preQ(1) synthase [Pseudomonadota bacterium]
MPSQPQQHLETFDNPAPGRDYLIAFDCPEFTCLCPLTGQPDFAHLYVRYVADHTCIELKSLKLYLWSYRDRGAFHEKVTNTILDDIVAAIAPRFCEVHGAFFVRGGIATTVVARHGAVPASLADQLARPPAEAFARNATRS